MGLFGRTESGPASEAGLDLRCEICKNTLFWHRRAQLHCAVASFFEGA